MKNEWIDLQVNGYGGVDFNAPGLTVEQVLAVTERLAAEGTVGYLPTLVTGSMRSASATFSASSLRGRSSPTARAPSARIRSSGCMRPTWLSSTAFKTPPRG